jgi:CDGSH-type Zn-finger protein
VSDDPVTIVYKKAKGPYLVLGPVEIRDSEGNPIEPPPAKNPGMIKLCGCGQSKTKPFCDGTHKTLQPPPDSPA